jgi:phage terminase small subunit
LHSTTGELPFWSFWGKARQIAFPPLAAVQSESPLVLAACFILKKGSDGMLTAKQEKFVQYIIEGKSQADAYRSAYSTKNMSDNAIYREASVMVDSPKIAQRLQELRDQIASENIMSAKKRLEWLTDLVNSAEESTNDKLKAIDIMNKMQGEYVQKIEADVNNEVTINIELSDDE